MSEGKISRRQLFKRYLGVLINIKEYVDVEKAESNIRSNIYFRGPNVLILICAIWIASLGLNVNSIPVIIGAMLISPLMGPIVGLGTGVGVADLGLVRDSVRNLGVMVLISIFASTIYFLVSPLRLDNPTELLARTNPTIYDVLIAFIGGMAGILETARKEKGTVISGVAIATALMPPLCTIGYGFSQWNWHYILGASYLFSINSIFIALSTVLGVKYLHFPQKDYDDKLHQGRFRSIATVILIILIIPSCLSAITMVRQNNFSRSAEQFVGENRSVGNSYVYDYQVNHFRKHSQLVLFLAGQPMTDTDRERIFASARGFGISPDQLVVREEATGHSLSEQELVKDIMQSNDQQIKRRDDSIAYLNAELSRYKLPSHQLGLEVGSQFPAVTSVLVAKGDKVLIGKENEVSTVAVIVETTKMLNDDEKSRLLRWLKVRLSVEDVELVVRKVS